jgi:hypothetical protein
MIRESSSSCPYCAPQLKSPARPCRIDNDFAGWIKALRPLPPSRAVGLSEAKLVNSVQGEGGKSKKIHSQPGTCGLMRYFPTIALPRL